MIPHLTDGQNIIVVPGNFSGLRIKKMMKEMGVEKKVTISETASMPYACRIDTYNTVLIYKKKFRMKMGTSPVSDNPEMLNVMNELFKGYIEFIPAKNLLEVDMDNANYVLHPFPVLLNYGEIEKNGKTFRHYMDGITPIISEKMALLDKERMEIGKKLGLELQDCLSQLKMYYGQNDSKTFYEFVNSDDSPYKDLVGQSVTGRYLTEDVPGVIVPVSLVAQKAGLKTPIADLAIGLASLLHNVNYVEKGTNLKTLGIENLSIEEIIKTVS